MIEKIISAKQNNFELKKINIWPKIGWKISNLNDRLLRQTMINSESFTEGSLNIAMRLMLTASLLSSWNSRCFHPTQSIYEYNKKKQRKVQLNVEAIKTSHWPHHHITVNPATTDRLRSPTTNKACIKAENPFG